MYVTVPLDVLEDKTVHMYTTLPICTLLEKISEKFKFQWIFVEGVGCKLHIIDISITYDFSLLPIKEYLLKYQFYPIFSPILLHRLFGRWGEQMTKSCLEGNSDIGFTFFGDFL